MATDVKALVRSVYVEVFGAGKLELIDDLAADDMVDHEGMPGAPAGKAGLEFIVSAFRAGFPDLTVVEHGIVADGDEVWFHGSFRGTHKGEFMGIPATGKSIDAEFIDRLRIEDGKACEHWGVTDNLAFMQQLGVIPEMGE
jgi:predicted ester cyclase